MWRSNNFEIHLISPVSLREVSLLPVVAEVAEVAEVVAVELEELEEPEEPNDARSDCKTELQGR